MRVITWNMNGNTRAWDYLRRTIGPRVALLQEAPILELATGEAMILNASMDSRGVPNRQGTAVYAQGIPIKRSSVMVAGQRFAVADIVVSGGLVVLVVSLHPDTKKSNLSAVRQIESALSTMMSSRSRTPQIVGGDLNAARNASQYWPGPRWRHDEFWRSIDSGAIGLHDCFRKFHSSEVQTYFFRGNPQTTGWRSRKFQLDHLFVSPDLYPQVLSCEILDTLEVRRLSDHLPVVAEIEL